jgi:radical SAM superfamily enzyme YgiQ (UPF0313 family)
MNSPLASRRFRRIVFIEPKSTHIHVYSAVHIPRIGGILLATMLRDRGYEVEVIIEDMLPRRTTDDAVWERIRTADLLCVSSITPTVCRCYMWCDRSRAARIPVIIGGTHVTYFPDEAAAHADFVMRGECDEAFPILMDTLEAEGDLSKVPGLSWHDCGELRHNPEPKLPASAVLEAAPFPDYELIWNTNLHNGVASFAAARGCPFNCSFCSVTKFSGAGVRAISAARTLDMIEQHWLRHRPHYIFFAEDIFNLAKNRAKEILRGLIDRRIRPAVGFGAQMRHEAAADTEFLQLLHEAKFDRAMVGFESVNQASLDLCGKRQTVDQIAAAIRAFHKFRIKVHGMFVAGFDTDTPQTFADTLRFVKRHHLDSFQFMLLSPLPGTRDWHQEGYADGSRPLLTRDWTKYDGHHAVQVPRLMSAYEANTQALGTMRSFYTLPRAIGRLLKGDWVEFIMRAEGRNLLRRWFKNPDNRRYLESLRAMVTPTAPAILAGARRRIIIAHTAASIAFKERFDSFFNELGVRVEHSREGLGELLAQGQSKFGEARARIGEFLDERQLFSRDRADIVILPTDCGSQVEATEQEIGGGAPLLVRLNINLRAKVLAQQSVQIAMRYTNDLLAAAEAFRHAMKDLAPEPEPGA